MCLIRDTTRKLLYLDILRHTMSQYVGVLIGCLGREDRFRTNLIENRIKKHNQNDPDLNIPPTQKGLCVYFSKSDRQ